MPFRLRAKAKVSGGGGGGGSLDTTHTAINTSGSTASNNVYQFGQVFARGAVPTGNKAVIQDANGNSLTHQWDEISLWDDGSWRHAVPTVFPPSVSGSATYTFKIVNASGSYSTPSAARSLTDITGSHDFEIQLTDVRNSSNALWGSGSFTFNLNDWIARGLTEKVATGPCRDSWVVYGFAVDDTPTTTTLSAAISTTNGTSVSVASATGFPGSGKYLVLIDNEIMIVESGQGTTSWTVTRGTTRSTAATHSNGATVTFLGHIWIEYFLDVYTDPTNSGATKGIAHIALTSLPWLNIVGAIGLHYRAKLVDGVSTVRDWSNSVTVAQGTAVNTTTNKITLGSAPWEEAECVEVSSDGTLPSPLAANTPYWIVPSGNDITLYSGSNGNWCNANTVVDITTTGSGNLTIRRRIHNAYRLGWWTAADDAGNKNFTAAVTTLRPQLTTTEKGYWEDTGMVPPYDTSYTPNSWGGTSDANSSKYRPSIAVLTANNIGVAGGPANVGVLPQWAVVAWMRQDATNFDYMRAAALGTAHMPFVSTLNEYTGRVKPFNNGPNRSGGSYSVLGTPNPTWTFNQISQSGVAVPSDFSSNEGLGWGVWGSSSVPGPALTHWPANVYLPYLMFGDRHLLHTLYRDGNAGPLMWHLLTGSGKRITISGTTYNAKFFQISGSAGGRHCAFVKNIVQAAYLGDEANPERAYFLDILEENLDFYDAYVALQPAGWDNLGFFDTNTVGQDGFISIWGAWSFLWGKALSRDSRYDGLLNRLRNNLAGKWDGSFLSPYYAPMEYTPTVRYGDTKPMNETTFVTSYATSWDDIGIAHPLYTLSFTNGSQTITFNTLLPGTKLADGDRIKIISPSFNNSAGTYDGPSEMNPRTVQEWFYIRNPSAEDGSGVTANISSTPTGSLITFSANLSGIEYCLRPAANPSTASGVINNSTFGQDPNSYGAIHLGAMNWLKSLGVTGLDTAITNAEARISVNYATNPRQKLVYRAVT